MASLYERIENLCLQKQITITIMCKESGASRGSLTDLKKGRKQSLSAETLTKIAAYFNVSVDYLLGNEQKEKPSDPKAEGQTDPLDEVDIAFYGDYKELDERDKDTIRDMVRVMRERRKRRSGD